MRKPLRLLILGGTTEGRELAEVLADDPRFFATISLAGRTDLPLALPLPVRSGGFGGVDGLKAYLADHGIEALIDATHPFASGITANARAACAALGLPLLVMTRPGWEAQPGDRWSAADTVEEAIAIIGPEPRCIFVTLGRSGLDALASAPQHIYLIRSVDPPDPLPALPNAHFMTARGPFSYAGEIALMRDYGVEWLLTKNSGGEATYAKIEAARRLGVPVAMVGRPATSHGGEATASTKEEALRWLTALLPHSAAS